jgi:hypothetical protein
LALVDCKTKVDDSEGLKNDGEIFDLNHTDIVSLSNGHHRA